MVNLEPSRTAEVTTRVTGSAIRQVTGEVLTAPLINAMNTFDQQNLIKPAQFGSYKIQDSQRVLSVPPKSVVVLELQ
ncbi:MAG TPA: alpha-L-arabinofuranosidase C-terminal domain-containing protein [Pyrinomonadaceae bacterium]